MIWKLFAAATFLSLNAQAALISQIEFTWEPVKKATRYEVEFKALKEGSEAKIYSVNKSEFSEEMPSGQYHVRIRTIGKEADDVSEWGPTMKINVVPASVEMLFPTDESTVRVAGNITFKWKVKPEAKKYIFRIYSKDRKFKRSHTTLKTLHTMNLPIGQTYYWQVHFKDKTNTMYESIEKPFKFNLMGKRLKTPELAKIEFVDGKPVLKWSGDKNSAAFALKLMRRDLFDEKWQVFKTYKELDKSEWSPQDRLPPGEYKVVLGANSPTHLASKKSSKTFVVKPKLEDLNF